MNVLVTGGAGFIGSHLCEKLLRDGHRVLCIDNFDPYYDLSLKRAHLRLLKQYPNFQFLEADIRNAQALARIFRENNLDCVVHLAAKAGVRPSIQHPEEYFDVNVSGAIHLLEAMRQRGVRRLVFASSSSVYGNQVKMPFAETDAVDQPISPYAASKKSGELIAHTYHYLYGFEVACLRLFTVYGPRQRPDLAIHKFTQLALDNQPIPLYGNGLTRRDYTYVGDIVQGITRLLERQNWGYQIFNLGSGAPVTLLEMVKALENALQRPLPIHFLDKQPGDVEQTHADISKARQFFGYQPTISFQEGVKQFVHWYQEHALAPAL